MELLCVGQPHPTKCPPRFNGAIAEFLNGANTLILFASDLSKEEIHSLKKGKIKCGILSKNGAIMLLWRFTDKKGRPLLDYDTAFNSKLIPKIQLHDIQNSNTRLVIEIHGIDSTTGILKVLRGITMSNELTIKFFSAVQDQLASSLNDNNQILEWERLQPMDLIEKTKMYNMGE